MLLCLVAVRIFTGPPLIASSILTVLGVTAVLVAVAAYQDLAESRRAQLRQIFIGAALLGAAVAAFANIMCAFVYGGVFLARGPGWAYFDTEPVRFLFSLGVSVIGIIGLSLLGGISILGARDERRFLERLRAAPRYEDPTHTVTLRRD